MNKMEKEIHYEGWLIKSPPTKRIWRARWRRRWFTLKQGEIPEQFCLEYYTDRNCRKLKGVIDLDQCEQVDCGLRLENRKQKFQFMFDIKTPKRTYYLAADTENDMRDWVNCICQVCHLHDTKQSNELQDENRTQNTASTALTNSSNNASSLNTSSPANHQSSGNAVITMAPASTAFNASLINPRQSINSDILRRPLSSFNEQQTYQNNADYVNTEYTNRETLLSSMRFDRNSLPQVPPSPGAASASATYLNSPIFGAAAVVTSTPAAAAANAAASSRLAVSSNGVVRKIPENLVLNNTPLPDTQTLSVQPSPALSTASGPYIPISECFSGSPKFLIDANNPTTPLNNLDPKFYDTPRSHNNIGLNLTNDQSYSPKITNCGLQQVAAAAKNRSHRSDSDSDSVFTDDDEWTHPMPLRENVDRNTRPSESSVENESFVLTYSKRFSKFPDDAARSDVIADEHEDNGTSLSALAAAGHTADPLDKLAKVLKNKNNLILNFREQEKTTRDLPQFSDTENTSPSIGPGDANTVVDESYDIPRSHNLPYYNMGQLLEKITSPESNPIAASTPNLMADPESPCPSTASTVRTLPRPHCYTNAAPAKVQGNVFRYDFIEQADLPPVNRQLKPKVSIEDKPPEELPAKPPVAVLQQNILVQPQSPNAIVDNLSNKLVTTTLQSPTEPAPLKPPSVDRKLKPNAYRTGNSSTMSTSARRSSGAPLSMVLLPHETAGVMTVSSAENSRSYHLESRTLPRQFNQQRYGNATTAHMTSGTAVGSGITIQHQRTASAAAALQMTPPTPPSQLQLPPKSMANEHKLQYFDLDVANPPAINRQSMSVGNLNTPGSSRLALSADPSSRAPAQPSVVYNSVDFVKTEAFKRIREERKKESAGNSANK